MYNTKGSKFVTKYFILRKVSYPENIYNKYILLQKILKNIFMFRIIFLLLLLRESTYKIVTSYLFFVTF